VKDILLIFKKLKTGLSDYKKSLELAKMIERKNGEESNLKAKTNLNIPSCFILMKKQIRKVERWTTRAKQMV
jgi:hypothetical protein